MRFLKKASLSLSCLYFRQWYNFFMQKKRPLLLTLFASVFAIGCSINEQESSNSSIEIARSESLSQNDEGASSESKGQSEKEGPSQSSSQSPNSDGESSLEESSNGSSNSNEESSSLEESSDSPSSEPASSVEEEGKTLTITFGNAKSNNGTTFESGTVEEVATLDGDNIVASLTGSNCYFSKIGSAMRIGSSDNGGSLIFTLSGEYHVNSISLTAFAWADNETSVKIGVSANAFNDNSKSPVSANFSEVVPFVYSINSDISSFTVSSMRNGKGRFLLASLSIDYGNGSSTPSSSESSEPTSSEESSSSSREEPSSSSSEHPIDDSNYYSSINWSKRGSALKSDLCALIGKNYKGVSYSSVASYYTYTDTDESGKIIDIYSTYRWNVNDNGGNYKKEGDIYNKEHIMPQSVFGKRSPMVSDIHHLFPTDGYVNGQRSNYPHGYVSSAKYTSTNGTKIGNSDSSKNNGYSGMCCEPIDEYKGDVARAYFYMVTRYGNLMSGWGDFAVIANNAFPSLSNWAIETYLEWNDLDPVSPKEIKRNNEIYKIQNNRNPFIDHPEASHYIWDGCI